MYNSYRIGIVVPAFNEEKLILRTLQGMPDIADRVYLVDDSSIDKTCDIVTGFFDRRILLLRHVYNQGVGAAIVTGYIKALEEGMDIIVVMAGDNQMDARHLPELLSPIIKGNADYAKGNRLSGLANCKGMSGWRFLGNWILTLLTRIASGYWHITDPQNGYTAITPEALMRINLKAVYPRYGYCNDLLVKLNVAGCRVADVTLPARYGEEKSKISYGKYITSVSVLLLHGLLWRLKMKYVLRRKQQRTEGNRAIAINVSRHQRQQSG